MISEINPPVIFEISNLETVPLTTPYHFTVPAEMAHLTNTMSVPTGFTVDGLAPINTQCTPNVTPTLPPRYRALNASVPTPPQTPSSSPSDASFPGHPIPSFIPTLPQFLSGNPNPNGTILSITPNLQISVGGQGGMIQFPLTGHIPITRHPSIGTQLLVGTPPTIGGPTPPFGQNIPPSLAQYWNQMIQNPPQMTRGQQLHVPTIGQPYPGIPNPIWGMNAQTHVPAQGYNPSSYYPLQPPLNLPGSSHYA
jgi:hypothetical protein